MFKLDVKVLAVKVILADGTDTVLIEFEGPTSYPELNAQFPNTGYEHPCFKVEARKGYGAEWVKSLGIPDDLVRVINTRGLQIINTRGLQGIKPQK